MKIKCLFKGHKYKFDRVRRFWDDDFTVVLKAEVVGRCSVCNITKTVNLELEDDHFYEAVHNKLKFMGWEVL